MSFTGDSETLNKMGEMFEGESWEEVYVWTSVKTHCGILPNKDLGGAEPSLLGS